MDVPCSSATSCAGLQQRTKIPDLDCAVAGGVASPRSRVYGGRDWVRLGAVELGLDCLRRYLQGLPVTERTAFERV